MVVIKWIIVIALVMLFFILMTNPYTLFLGILIGPPAFKIICWIIKEAANIIKSLGF